jgi:hypothetical protein
MTSPSGQRKDQSSSGKLGECIDVDIILTRKNRDYSMRYRPELELVLKKISLKIVSRYTYCISGTHPPGRTAQKRLVYVGERVLESPRCV